MGPLSYYAKFVRQHPDETRHVEQLVGTMTYMFMNVNNVLTMETLMSLNRTLATINNELINTSSWNLDKKLSVASQVVSDTQVLGEMYCRTVSRESAAYFSVLVTAFRTIISIFVKRLQLKSRWNALRPGAGGAAPSKLVIPGVSVPSRNIEAAASSFPDMVMFVVDLFYTFRGLIYTLLVLADVDRTNKKYKVSWRVFRFMLGLEAVGAVSTWVCSSRRRPVVSTEVPEDSTEEENPIAAQRTAALMINLFRDPFFPIAVRALVERFLVNGFISKIPLIGMIVSTQTKMALKLQQESVLYTLGKIE